MEGRKKTFEVLESQLQENTDPVIWIHCASLGEFEQGRPVIEKLKAHYLGHKILLTFFSPSGYEVRKNYEKADYIHYLPKDSAKNAEELIRLTKPVLALFVKYEFWFFYLRELNRHHIPTLSISSIFRENQLFFKKVGHFQRRGLSYIDHFFVQNETSQNLLHQINISQVTVSGDTRFDRVFETCRKAELIPGIQEFIEASKVMVIGSSWPEDMAVLIPFIKKNDLKFIIAPHEISESGIMEIAKNIKKPYAFYSQGVEQWLHKEVLIIDNIGLLSRLYKYGNYAYVGGAFGKGLHNTLEAATFGLPVFFGNKNYQKFDEAVQLAEMKAAFPIGSYEELQAKFNSLSDQAGQRARNFVAANLGATEKIMAFVKEKL